MRRFARAAKGRFFRLMSPLRRKAAEAEREARQGRTTRAALLICLVLFAGTYGYYELTDHTISLLDCLYATVLTVSTVGFQEVIPIRESDALIWFTIGLITFGGGSLLYFVTSITAMVIEGDLLYRFWRRRMLRRIDNLNHHIVVCGAGRSGMHTIRELRSEGTSLVVIDMDPTRIEIVLQEFGDILPHLVGDALEEQVLRAAGIDRADGLIAALHDDRDNLYLSLSARQLNADLRIVAKVDEAFGADKFRRVGVDGIVSPALMGGRRMASEMVRPEVASFVGSLHAATDNSLSLAEINIPYDGPYANISLREADLRSQANCLVVGARSKVSGPYVYNPLPDERLHPGGSILALGDPEGLAHLRALLESSNHT